MKLCSVCGVRALKVCSPCRRRQYCCRDHQVLDWRAGHAAQCASGSSFEPRCLQATFPQYEILIEDEDDIDESELTPNEKGQHLVLYSLQIDEMCCSHAKAL